MRRCWRPGRTPGGIVLLHHARAQTAAMIPAFRRALKTRGFRIMHGGAASQRPAGIGQAISGHRARASIRAAAPADKNFRRVSGTAVTFPRFTILCAVASDL
jgi:hypothetical protein